MRVTLHPDGLAPLRLRASGHELRFSRTLPTFGARLTSPVAELAIESFFPADAETGAAPRGLDRG
jgi:hypothetical protein